MHEASGKYKPRQERLDWMYEGAVQVATTAEYLEGKKAYKPEQEEESKEALALFQASVVTAEQEAWNRVQEDPLLEMRKQEQKSLDHIKKNPVQMAMIKSKLYQMEKFRKQEKKRKRKEKKVEKNRNSKSSSEPIKTGYGLVFPKGSKTTEPTETRELKDFEEIKKDLQRERRKEREERDKETRKKRDERRRRQDVYRKRYTEDRKRKLEEMQRDAEISEERRNRRMKRHKEAEHKKDTEDEHKDDKINFLNDVRKKAYSKAGVATLEERLKRNVHFRHRGNLDEANTFSK